MRKNILNINYFNGCKSTVKFKVLQLNRHIYSQIHIIYNNEAIVYHMKGYPRLPVRHTNTHTPESLCLQVNKV